MLGYRLLLIDVVDNHERCVGSILAMLADLNALLVLGGTDVNCGLDGRDVVGF